MSNFDEFLNLAKSQVVDLAKALCKDCAEAAIADGNKFLDDCKPDLELWTSQLASDKLSQDDFEYLIKTKKDVAVMDALKRAGLTSVRIDKFRSALLDALVKTAIKFIP